jgi:hypothetical protein
MLVNVLRDRNKFVADEIFASYERLLDLAVSVPTYHRFAVFTTVPASLCCLLGSTQPREYT